ncbi:uteroglobin [Sorex araneus]|uniref:uteroglobin n=1 Tax=Sorex araneus TaxID=42254 RepID=UPI000157FAEE|nr:uteroglobin [Sorex araneus]
MKLAITFAVVMLALCCGSATAQICPDFLEVLRTLFEGPTSGYEAAISVFNPTEEMRSSAVTLKNLLNVIPPEIKEGAAKLTQKIIQSPQCA